MLFPLRTIRTVTNNYRRHDEVQRFMLATDSVTVAVEVPIFLTPEDLAHMQDQLGFNIPFQTGTTLTGHIDVLQLRNGSIHILDRGRSRGVFRVRATA